MSRLAAALERRGLIVRQREPANRRVYRLQLTDDGRVVADRLGKDLRAHHQQLLGALTPTEPEALTVGLAGRSASWSPTTSSHPQPGRTRDPAGGRRWWNTTAAYALTLHDR